MRFKRNINKTSIIQNYAWLFLSDGSHDSGIFDALIETTDFKKRKIKHCNQIFAISTIIKVMKTFHIPEENKQTAVSPDHHLICWKLH